MGCYQLRLDFGHLMGHDRRMNASYQQEDRQPDGFSDRRWVVLMEDGRYFTFGRARDPNPDEVARAE